MKRASTLTILVTVVSLLSGFFLWGALVATHDASSLASYTFRPLALLSLASGILNLALVVLLFRRVQTSETGAWFLMHIGTLTLWSLAEFMQRMSGTVEVAEFWRSVAIFGWAVMPIPYFFFALSYVEKQQYTRKLFLHTGFFLSLTALIYANFHSDILVSRAYTLQSWGYDSQTLWAINVFTLWFFVVFLSSAALMAQEYKKTLSKLKRTQIKLILFSLSIPLIGGTFTDVLLPNIFNMNVLPMAAFLTGTAGLVLSIAVYRYGLFNLNPASLSGEIMETLPQPVIGADDKFEIQFMNANASRMFSQYAPFINKSIKDIVGEENFKTIQNSLNSAENSKDVVSIERIPLGLQSGIIITQAQIRRVHQGDLNGYIFALSNITQQVLTMKVIEKEVRVRTELYNQERARLLSSVNGLRQGFLITDNQGRILLMNHKAQELFPNIKVSDTQSGHVVDIKAIDAIQAYFADFNLADNIKKVINTNKYIETDQVEFNNLIFEIEVLPISEKDAVIGAVILLNDITEHKLVERSKDEFFSIASHELRTPLTAIRGNTSMIMNYFKDQIDDPLLQEMVKDIHGSSLRLIEIVNDFLDTSRLEQGRMVFNLQEVKISDILGSVVKDTQAVARDKGDIIKVDHAVDNLQHVYADPDKLKQVFYNLIGNAIKFTDNGAINIRAEANESFAKIIISDEGRGISEESRNLLFRKFQQATDSLITRDTTKGTGLGLYISKMIVENMGGLITLEESVLGKGSAFSFTIPLFKPGMADNPINNLTQIPSVRAENK